MLIILPPVKPEDMWWRCYLVRLNLDRECTYIGKP